MTKRTYRNVVFDDPNNFHGEYSHDGSERWVNFGATMSLHHIHAACDRSEEATDRIWDTQDGYGIAGFTPEQGWDWSGIRDSSDEAVAAMWEIAREYVSDAEIREALGAGATA